MSASFFLILCILSSFSRFHPKWYLQKSQDFLRYTQCTKTLFTFHFLMEESIYQTLIHREMFSFAHPVEQILAVEKYCTAVYSINLWDLSGKESIILKKCLQHRTQTSMEYAPGARRRAWSLGLGIWGSRPESVRGGGQWPWPRG